ncbi:hypothetical protein N788_06340 [Arenimonas donghaensis DSM 18148 = HO3-R19]|uniref:Glycosyltransferase RgtA/B/C/D-like domain-containing protein n=1 Tax=Arenimonas donghaensis DSM 18148 = HO3-R19 TaxID=1121014 RepID=A0A087MG85_9GAMM|nr:hypothetical protein N788_06340 [Arenimonas donghaensis DSM 18148 = HO3-R19]
MLTLLALAALGGAAFWPGLSGGYLFDDLPNLAQSRTWKVDSLAPAALWAAMTSDISGAVGRPLAMLSFAINHALTGEHIYSLKLTNLLMHLVNASLVFVLCRQLLVLAPGECQAKDRAPPRVTLAAGLVAAAWLVHPLQVSTVLYTVQRMEIGAATGLLVCLATYLAARSRQLAGRPATGYFALAAAGLLGGLGFKESALVAPGLLLLLEAFVLRFRGPGGRLSRPIFGLHAVWLAAALLAYFIVVLPDAVGSSAYEARGYSAGQRLLSQGPILVMYLGQILIPSPDSMLFYYDHLQVPAGLFSPPRTAGALATLVALLGLALAIHRRWPLTALGIFWFFACHALTSNVIPLELAFEHRNYLALLGPLLALVELSRKATARLHGDAAFTAMSLPVLLLAGLCFLQASTWSDPFRLHTALAGRNADSPRANYALGVELHALARGDTRSPQWALARRQFEHAARLPQASALPDQALVVMDSTQGTPVPRAIWEPFASKLLAARPRPDDISALHNVVACRLTGRCHIPDAYLLDLLDRLDAGNPYFTEVGIIRANFLWNGPGARDEAINALRERRSRRKNEYEVDIALAQFLMASNLHANKGEILMLLDAAGAQELPPATREKVRLLAEQLDAATREEGPRQ